MNAHTDTRAASSAAAAKTYNTRVITQTIHNFSKYFKHASRRNTKIRSKRGNMITEYSVQRLKVRSFIFIALPLREFSNLQRRKVFYSIYMNTSILMYLVLPYDEINCLMMFIQYFLSSRYNECQKIFFVDTKK